MTLVSAASMAGFPLMFGFVAKEDAFAALEPGSFAYAGLVLTPVVLASVLTVAYSLRFAWGALGFAGTGDAVARARRRRGGSSLPRRCSPRSPSCSGSCPPRPTS